LRLPRISVWMLLVAVAVTAFLIPFPWQALFLSLWVFSVGVMPPTILILVVDSRGYRRASLVITVSIAVIASCLLSRFRDGPIHSDWFLFSWFTACLTPINLAGPLLAIRQYWNKERLFSGQILWAWMGLAWLVLLEIPVFRYSHGPWIFKLEVFVEFARLTAVLALLLAVYGKRPSPPDPVWLHRIGWAVAESDAIAWGWYAVL
jgi:hypothetical protein